MTRCAVIGLGICCFLILRTSPVAQGAEAFTEPAVIQLDEAGALVVDGRKVFPITLTIIPGADAKAPSGKHAYEEFADSGAMFMRTGGPEWDEKGIEKEKATQDAAAAHGMRCSPWLGWDLANFDRSDAKKEAELKK